MNPLNFADVRNFFRTLDDLNREQLYCYWCAEEGKRVAAFEVLRAPVDADDDGEGRTVPVYAEIGMCEAHLHDYANREGVYEQFD